MPKRLRVTLLVLLIAWRTFAAEPAAKPGNDGFPTGKDSPEGAACDLARAFIHDDAALFLATCVEPYGSAEARAAYHRFLEGIVVQMKGLPAGNVPSPDAPESIVKCFAARHLTNIPTGSAAFGFQDVVFVDVSAQLHNGSSQICRTLVIKSRDGKWAVDPQPEQSPLMITGLDDESPSTREFPASPLAK